MHKWYRAQDGPRRRGSGCHLFKWGQGKAASPINSSLYFSLSWRQPLLTAFVFQWHSSEQGVSWLCVHPGRLKVSTAGGWQRLSGAEQPSLWKLGCLEQAVLWLCVKQKKSVRGERRLQPFVICCKWCQRLWLKISRWLVRQLAD